MFVVEELIVLHALVVRKVIKSIILSGRAWAQVLKVDRKVIQRSIRSDLEGT